MYGLLLEIRRKHLINLGNQNMTQNSTDISCSIGSLISSRNGDIPIIAKEDLGPFCWGSADFGRGVEGFEKIHAFTAAHTARFLDW